MLAGLISLPNPAVAPMFEGNHSQLRTITRWARGIKWLVSLLTMVAKILALDAWQEVRDKVMLVEQYWVY